MNQQQSNEVGRETVEHPFVGRELRSLDDIPREIADRRLHAEFGELIASEKSEALRETPDVIEDAGAFEKSARDAGLSHAEGVLGWSTHLEAPAHVLRGDVGKEIATLIHEDLHRVTHPESLGEMTANPESRELYEGLTEHLTEKAVAGLHEHKSGECYPVEVHRAEALERLAGETELRNYFFKHELPETIAKAVAQMGRWES